MYYSSVFALVPSPINPSSPLVIPRRRAPPNFRPAVLLCGALAPRVDSFNLRVLPQVERCIMMNQAWSALLSSLNRGSKRNGHGLGRRLAHRTRLTLEP